MMLITNWATLYTDVANKSTLLCVDGRGGWLQCHSVWQSSSTTSVVGTFYVATLAAGLRERPTISLH